MSIAVSVADAVVALLATAELGQAIAPERQLLPVFRRQQADAMQVVVIPGGRKSERQTRGARTFEVEVDVALSQAADQGNQATVAAMLDLLDLIDEALCRQGRLPAYPQAAWIGSQTLPGALAGYAAERLREKHESLCLLRVTYQVSQ